MKRTKWRRLPEHIKRKVIDALKRDTTDIIERNRQRSQGQADTEQPDPVADCNMVQD